jgi:hypothetical protein
MLFFLTKEHDEGWKDCGTFPTFKVGLCGECSRSRTPQAPAPSSLLAARLVMGLCARGWLQAKFNAIM